ncbi:hypothetical protein HG530_015102 [Fusarium avenaceum]|nr:hypothetical protein HG530_015102 [Fusarium avenaceum]
MDTRLEGLVDGADSEDRDEGVTLHVLLGSLSQEHIGLVKQENTIPQVSETEDVLERRLNRMWRETKITAGDNKQGLSVLHSHSLSRGSLSDTRNTMQQHHKTTTLALDQILAGSLSRDIGILALKLLPLEMGHDQAANNVLVVTLNAEVLENAGLATHGLENVQVDGQEASLAKSIREHTLGKENKVFIAKVEGLGVGLECSASLHAHAKESVNSEVVSSLTGLDTIGLLDDLILSKVVAIMVDVVSRDLELGVLIDRLLVCEEVPARGGGPEIVELDTVGGSIVKAVVQGQNFLVNEVNIASHISKSLRTIHKIVVVLILVGVDGGNRLGVAVILINVKLLALFDFSIDDLWLNLDGLGALAGKVFIVSPLVLKCSQNLSHLGLEVIVGLIDVLESVLEVLEVDLSDFRNLGSPFGGSTASISENTFTSLGLLLESHVFNVILSSAAVIVVVGTAAGAAPVLESCCLAAETAAALDWPDRAGNDDLRGLLNITLLVALLQQSQERHTGVPHGRRVDSKGVHVGIKVSVEVRLGPVLQAGFGSKRDDLRPSNTRVAYQEVDVPSFFLDLGCNTLQIGLRGDVALNSNDSLTQRACYLIQLLFSSTGDVNLRSAILKQSFHHHKADA